MPLTVPISVKRFDEPEMEHNSNDKTSLFLNHTTPTYFGIIQTCKIDKIHHWTLLGFRSSFIFRDLIKDYCNYSMSSWTGSIHVCRCNCSVGSTWNSTNRAFYNGIIFYWIEISYFILQSKSDRLFNTQSRVLQADWLILVNNEKATLNINLPYGICNGRRNFG